MAGKKPYYTSDDLIAAVQRSINIPLYQLTYTDEDILAFATEELFLAQVPSIMQFHEEYFVYEQEVTLVASKSKYPIPSRAIGMKLRDVFFKDANDNLIEMNKVNPDDKAHFQDKGSSSSEPVHYYLQNNSIVLVPDVSANVTGSLVYTYYLRPNSLVKNERAVICESFSKNITITNGSIVAGDTITIGSYVLEADSDFAIGGNASVTGTNIVSAIAALADIDLSATSSSGVVIVTYQDRDLTFSTSNSTAFAISASTTINSSQALPSDMVDGMYVDFLQTEGGHNTYSMDVRLTSGSVAADSITILDTSIPEDFVVGDYVCLAGESIIPQVPTDLHVLLAERTCARILSAQGDQAGLQNSNTKIQDYEQRQASVIDSRVDGSPTKVFNRHSLLRYGKSRRNI